MRIPCWLLVLVTTVFAAPATASADPLQPSRRMTVLLLDEPGLLGDAAPWVVIVGPRDEGQPAMQVVRVEAGAAIARVTRAALGGLATRVAARLGGAAAADPGDCGLRGSLAERAGPWRIDVSLRQVGADRRLQILITVARPRG